MRSVDGFFLVGAWLAFLGNADAGELQVLTTEVPPMAFVRDGKLQGFCVDIVEEIQHRLGQSSHIAVMPWARAYHKAQIESNTMLVCPKRTAERETQFQWVGPLLSTHTNIYAKAGAIAKLASLDQAKRLSSILVVRASYSYQNLAGGGFHNLYEVNNAASMVRMLMADRAPAMMLERQELDEVLIDAGIAPQALNSIFEMPSPTSNLAFSSDIAPQIVRQWQAALDAIKKDGSYNKLHDKWFPPQTHGRRH
ncbi:ABC transporter substrate-binding protein [Rugamonas sp.]|uniref:substrate-binding periplasmic protein n=1 Tax=Rugamonas sp. TaxID=1926287 RepID=UPI0025EB07EF|nr:ABC transporter substrate-binding protein [Rugamonas sp.]